MYTYTHAHTHTHTHTRTHARTHTQVYACGEGTNGRLGVGGYSDVSAPRLLVELSMYVVRKIAVNTGGRHAMALTADGKVFSWGDGEYGQLGHGDNK